MSRTIYTQDGVQTSLLESKIAELKRSCNAAITAGIDVETSQGIEHFSLSTEDQINIQNLVFQITTGAPVVLYHSDGEICRPFTAEEFGAVAASAVRHVTFHTTRINHFKAWAERTADPDELQLISYSSELPDDLAASIIALLGGGAE
ncbi:MAG: hypothetical protein LBN00_06185 [Oscillospiraceae bacterium]|jgi:hypothetical protein|nr:hypothetical protein [Oscillospiraceae bacterium]